MLNIKQLTIEKNNEVSDNIKNIKGTKLELQWVCLVSSVRITV